ncbi:MAG: DUF3078 domain-containing protein [Cyclobacteriaceae bacterium]|nr:DUF3078 domain-containing protein [Cyclobacteriaceae bacterium]
MFSLKSFSTLLFLVTLSIATSAQIVRIDSATFWKKNFKAGLNLNQSSFSTNWKAGGVNSFGFNAFLNTKINYKKEKKSWTNEVDLLYGMVNNDGQGFRKTLDRIYLDTKYGYDFNENWGLFTALNFSSQFAEGFKYEEDVNGVEQGRLISNFLAPAFITGSLGFEYSPDESFKLRLAPIASRLTIVQNSRRYLAVDSVAPYGVKVGETLRVEALAFQMLAEYNKDIAENLNLKWRYLFFANYQTLEAKTIDHRLDMNITAQVNKFINVSLGGILLYDFDQDSGVQLSQAFSLGFLYTFQNYKDKKRQ